MPLGRLGRPFDKADIVAANGERNRHFYHCRNTVAPGSGRINDRRGGKAALIGNDLRHRSASQLESDDLSPLMDLNALLSCPSYKGRRCVRRVGVAGVRLPSACGKVFHARARFDFPDFFGRDQAGIDPDTLLHGHHVFKRFEIPLRHAHQIACSRKAG